MTGKDLKERLRSEGVNFTFLSQKLGYACDQNLHSVLSAKDVRSGLIEDIAEALGKPITWLYGDNSSSSTTASENGIAVTGDNNNIANISEGFIALLKKKDEQIDTLLELIKLNSINVTKIQ
jgi:hypothetical protein